ncbi:nose resistant to fluoxetine protein 6 [Stomoxys calcitrans]|uniref:Nose resistant-to-fluoxetine protein N-terminal domain-containing protein n=1 Tax=Stomoxys calcitrans TaxID=35570 RepID=A0A1I8NS18_STOCA|nr:nose resistant to fluoxetine protein 6 [Stomoxys calcitrans]
MCAFHSRPIAAFLPLLLLASIPSLYAAIENGDGGGGEARILNITQHLETVQHELQPLNLRLYPTNDSSTPSLSTPSTMPTDTDVVDLKLTLRLKEMLNIFDLSYLASQWINVRSDVSANCSQDIYKYFQGLQQAKIWAMKMDDASGHYASGFFYGNNYWMGSMSLCKAIYHYDDDDDEARRSAAKNSGLPFAKVHTQTYTRVHNENPSFIPGFYIIKLLFNETFPTSVIRTIYIGVCLPSTCSSDDVKQIATYAQRPIDSHEITLLDVRVPTDREFNIFKDRTFWILIVISTIVAILIIAGTLYEVYLRRRFREALRQQDKEMMNNSETSSGIGCAASDYSDSMTNDSLKKETLKDLNIVLNLPHNVNTCGPVTNTSTSDEHLEGHLHEPEKLSIYSELLLSFSAITNFNAICDRNVGSDTIPSIHGLRAFSMAWVILGHTCIVIFKYSDNLELRKDVEKNFFFQAITNGPFSVDTFFFISGVLVSYLYFRTNAKGNLNKLIKGSNELTRCTAHFFGMVMYRFMRLTAPYMFVLGVVQVSMKYLAAYSIFDPPTMDHITCPDYWWRNALYINTLFPVEQMCMLWSWYLANDTQFYIIGALILIVGVRHFKLSAITTGVFLVLSWVTTAVIAFSNNHRPDTDDPLALFDKIYDKPWTRLGPYLIGMAVGWILFRTNCKIRLSKTKVAVAWILASVNLFVLIFGLYRAELSQLTAALYSSLSHSAWALSLAWITIACSTGYGGFVNTLLSAPCLYPFSRVTYCAYLVHPIVIRSMALNTDSPLHLGGDTMVIMFFGFVVASYLLSFVVSMSFEAPVVTMLKILSPSRKKRLS